MKFLQVIPNSIRRNAYWITDAAYLPIRGLTALRYMLTTEEHPPPSIIQETTQKSISNEDSSRHISFTFAVISLSALVARADGMVSKEEYLAFRDAFPLTGGMCGKIRQLFLLACQSQNSPTSHVQQIKILFPNQSELYHSLVDRMFRIAAADKPLSRTEERLIAKISHALGLSPAEYSGLYEQYSRPMQPHVVLGVAKRSPREVIKRRYRQLMNRYHPDRYTQTKVSPEVQMLLTLKSSEISQAYRSLTRKAA